MSGAKEWRTHLDSMIKHEGLLKDIFPDVASQLIKIGSQMEDISSRIQTQEKHIQEKFSHLVGEFKEKHVIVRSLERLVKPFDSDSIIDRRIDKRIQ